MVRQAAAETRQAGAPQAGARQAGARQAGARQTARHSGVRQAAAAVEPQARQAGFQHQTQTSMRRLPKLRRTGGQACSLCDRPCSGLPATSPGLKQIFVAK